VVVRGSVVAVSWRKVVVVDCGNGRCVAWRRSLLHSGLGRYVGQNHFV
jgi:hypothetical protein